MLKPNQGVIAIPP